MKERLHDRKSSVYTVNTGGGELNTSLETSIAIFSKSFDFQRFKRLMSNSTRIRILRTTGVPGSSDPGFSCTSICA